MAVTRSVGPSGAMPRAAIMRSCGGAAGPSTFLSGSFSASIANGPGCSAIQQQLNRIPALVFFFVGDLGLRDDLFGQVRRQLLVMRELDAEGATATCDR